MTVSDLDLHVAGDTWMAQNTGAERPTPAEIAQLACYFYETRGRQEGRDVEDWLLAEQELTQHYWLVADNT